MAAVVAERAAEWISGSSVKQCPGCGCDFGLFTRRHHCRACGGVFCASCSNRKAKNVRGYKPTEEVRVCNTCYFELAYIVVWHAAFSYHHEIVGDLESAKRIFAKIPDYASRALLRIGSGEVIMSWFCRDSWKQRVLTFAACKRKLHCPSIATTIPTGTPQTAPFAAPAAAAPSVSATAVAAPTTPATPFASAIAPVGPALRMAHFVAWKTNDEPALQYAWVSNLSGPEAAIADATTLLANVKPYAGVVLALSGELVHLVNTTWMMRSDSFITEARNFMNALPSTLGWHSGGEAHSRRAGTSLIAALQDMVALGPHVAAILLDDCGAIIADTCVNVSLREGLAKHVGSEAFARLRVPFVMVCHPPATLTQFQNIYLARAFVMAHSSSALFAPGADARAAPQLLQRHPLNTRTGALSLEPLARKCCEAELRGAARETERSGSGSPTTCATAAAPAAPGASAVSLDCGICMTGYDADRARPVICASCGNTCCAQCFSQMSVCAFCRKPLTAPVPNVQLLQLISGVE